MQTSGDAGGEDSCTIMTTNVPGILSYYGEDCLESSTGHANFFTASLLNNHPPTIIR